MYINFDFGKTKKEYFSKGGNKMKVKECMCCDVHYIMPESKIYEAAKMMSQYHIGSIPVCDTNKNVCGIITDRDIILRGVACDKDVKQTPVSDIMTCNVWTCKENDDMENAQNQMAENQIRRLPVCDNSNKLVGILTLGNLAQNDSKLGTTEVCNTIGDICNCSNNEKNAE